MPILASKHCSPTVCVMKSKMTPGRSDPSASPLALALVHASRLGHAAALTKWVELDPAVRAMALDLFTDALAVIAAGTEHAQMRALAHQVKAVDGPATFIGERRGAALRDAIFLNGAAITVLQRQDGYSHAKGHPASQLTPVLLALAERDRSPAQAMLSAFVAGYEVAARVGIALGGVPSWLHDLGNWANIGVAAAAAHLLGQGDGATIAAAIDSAASLGLSFDRYTTAGGATAHHLYAASAVVQALAAAEGAAAGLTSLPGSLERFYGPKLGADFTAAKLGEGIGENGSWARFEIMNGYFKLHPSCAHMHGVSDAVALLIAEAGIAESNVEAIDVATFAEAMAIDTATPHNDLAARFSLRATVAAAVRYGKLDDAGLDDLAALRPLMNRISVRHDPALDAYAPAGRPGVVQVRLRDGTTVERAVIYPRGTPQAPATAKVRHAKAHDLLSRHYGTAGAERVMAAVRALGDGAPVAELSAALRQ
ncbi:MAG: hypothetical protein EXQ84_06020 [Rhodospirillaceae bacterium]|nr:hypothetical protein [Rhodospirillaceae bacterium]